MSIQRSCGRLEASSGPRGLRFLRMMSMLSRMRVYLDCEFNGLGGGLKSMARVTGDGRSFYHAVDLDEAINPWVAEHVIPVLGDVVTLAPQMFRYELGMFLSGLDGAEFIADWPADFQHLTEQMTLIGAARGFTTPSQCTE